MININLIFISLCFIIFYMDLYYIFITKYFSYSVLYIPKILIIFSFFLLLFKKSYSIKFYYSVFFLFLFTFYSLIFNDLIPVFYHLYLFGLLFIGLFNTNIINLFSRKYFSFYLFIFFQIIIIFVLNFFIDFTHSTNVDAANILFNRELVDRVSTVFDLKRISGFYRTWDIAAYYIAVFGFYLIYYQKIRFIKSLIFIATLLMLIITTSKSATISFIIISFVYAFDNKLLFRLFVYFSILLHITSFVISNIDLSPYSQYYEHNFFLASLEMRIYQVWSVIRDVNIFGNGFGSIGSPTYLTDKLVMTDNNFFHVYYIFGIFSFYMLYVFVRKTLTLYNLNSIYKFWSYLGLLVMWSSLVTDVIQFSITAIVMGTIFFFNVNSFKYE